MGNCKSMKTVPTCCKPVFADTADAVKAEMTIKWLSWATQKINHHS